MRYLRSVLDVVADRTAEELTGGLLVAVALSLLMTGIYALARRKAKDPFVVMCGLVLVACVASMVAAGGYVRYALDKHRPNRVPPYVATSAGRGFLTRQIFDAADTDRDGRLSEDEAARAAESFVRSLNTNGPADEAAVRSALRDRLGQPPAPGLALDPALIAPRPNPR